MNQLRAWLMDLAYPAFECEDCIGMREHGCYCSAMNAVAPCTPPSKRIRLLRWILSL